MTKVKVSCNKRMTRLRNVYLNDDNADDDDDDDSLLHLSP
jgi:hypothetical protein